MAKANRSDASIGAPIRPLQQLLCCTALRRSGRLGEGNTGILKGCLSLELHYCALVINRDTVVGPLSRGDIVQS